MGADAVADLQRRDDMEVLRKPIAVVLAVIGIAVTVRHVLGTYYIDALRDLDLQTVLDPFMAVAVALALIVQFVGKRNLDAKITGDTITRTYLETNLVFYATVLLALQVFGDWIGNVPGPWWQYPLFVVIMGVTGLRLWRDSSGG